MHVSLSNVSAVHNSTFTFARPPAIARMIWPANKQIDCAEQKRLADSHIILGMSWIPTGKLRRALKEELMLTDETHVLGHTRGNRSADAAASHAQFAADLMSWRKGDDWLRPWLARKVWTAPTQRNHSHARAPGPRVGFEKRRLLPSACAAKNMADVERLQYRQSSTNQGTHAHEYLRHHIRGIPGRALDSGSSRRIPRECKPSVHFLCTGSRIHPWSHGCVERRADLHRRWRHAYALVRSQAGKDSNWPCTCSHATDVVREGGRAASHNQPLWLGNCHNWQAQAQGKTSRNGWQARCRNAYRPRRDEGQAVIRNAASLEIVCHSESGSPVERKLVR